MAAVELLILAGGRSSRMGRPKDEVRLAGGETFLERLVRELRPLGLPIVLSAGLAPSISQLRCGLELVLDSRPHEGPLAAIARAWEVRGDVDLLVVCCDQILLTADVLRRVIKASAPATATIGDPAKAAAAEGAKAARGAGRSVFTVSPPDGLLIPFPGLFSAADRGSIEASLLAGNRSPRRWAEAADPILVPLNATEAARLRSFNSPLELTDAGIPVHAP